MQTLQNNASGFDRHEPLPGYRTLDLLGRGGCGEVWRAIAPGGIAKAIKIIYGEDPSRVANEMRALARIKDVRHPLLLSIERIEMVGGNLVMVTELADHSLKDHFLRLREAEAVGVPQEELLQYIADTADVLDFLYDKFSLQHLDVKPENILIVSARAKLGDFGLVKSLYERSASLVGGLTPTYAPPELFEGKPTRQSDQYSLAIVYMQMLTGVLPFSGSSMAQIATQHLRGVPDLSVLPYRQRAVIARALSKEPGQRYESCMALVKALRATVGESAGERSDVSLDVCTLGSRGEPANRQAATNKKSPTRAATKPVSPLPPVPGKETDGSPAILVGVGGAGVEVLAKVVSRLRDRFGAPENWPPVEMLLLDTNCKAISSHFQEAELARVHVMPIPLRSAEDYGATGNEHLRWLGRRWYFNIPRDLSTGGFRPYGRLALMTHAHAVREALAGVVGRAKRRSPGAVPRVMLVSSISGGTGGGAIPDLAYALRGELKSRGLPDENLEGLLLHSTARSNAERDKARANAYATLSELNHYSRRGAHYPGEPLLETPPFHGDNSTFGTIHLLHLGDGLGQHDWDLATDRVAELVYCANFTPARQILNPTPAQRGEDAARRGRVRSCHVLSLGAGTSATIAQAAQIACSDVVKLWREGAHTKLSSSSSTPTAVMKSRSSHSATRAAKVEAAVRAELTRCKLDGEDLVADCARVLEMEVGGVGQFVEKIIDQILSSTASITDNSKRIDRILEGIEMVLQCETEGDPEDSADQPLFPQIVSRLSIRTQSRADAFIDWIKSLVDSRAVRVDGAREHAAETRSLLLDTCLTILSQSSTLHGSAMAVAVTLRSDEPQKQEKSGIVGWMMRRKAPDDKARAVLCIYVETRLKELLLRAAEKRLRYVDANVTQLIDQLDHLARGLGQLCRPDRELQALVESSDEPPRDSDSVIDGYRQKMLQMLRQRRPDIAVRIDESIQQEVFGDGPGLRRLLDPDAEAQKLLLRPLATSARQAVLECIRDISCQLIGGNRAESVQTNSFDLAQIIASSLPAGSDDQRFNTQLLIVPDNVDLAELRERLAPTHANLSIVSGHKCDVTLCGIDSRTSLARIAAGIIGGVEVYKELAAKLHTRVDFEWTPLAENDDDSDAAPEASRADEVADSSPTVSKTMVITA